MINNVIGIVIFIVGFLVMFGFNSLMKVIIYGVVMVIIGIIVGIVGFIVFKKYFIIIKK